MAGIAAAFLLALPFTGLSSLWGTKFAGGLLMGASVVLILLLNAAYQAGEKPANGFIAWVTRMGCCLLVPLCALAGYGLMLRQHKREPNTGNGNEQLGEASAQGLARVESLSQVPQGRRIGRHTPSMRSIGVGPQ